MIEPGDLVRLDGYEKATFKVTGTSPYMFPNGVEEMAAYLAFPAFNTVAWVWKPIRQLTLVKKGRKR